MVRQLRSLIHIRTVEEFLADQLVAGQIVCPCHLAIGQEAVPVGVSAHLRPSDRVFGNHRSHGHFLALGGSTLELLAEVLGKANGCSHGMGGSMHLQDRRVGFIGSVPIVGATVPMAVGAALAARMDGRGDVAVAYFGDGATEEGVVQESLNFASRFDVPVVFVAENNLFSSHLHILERQPDDSLARFAAAHGIEHRVVDGNDVVAVGEASKELIGRARAGGGPGFIEAVTYRWRGHVGASEDIDVGVQRAEGLQEWKKRDCIGRLATSLERAGHVDGSFVHEHRTAVERECEIAWGEAMAAPYPESHQLLDFVFGGGR
jgi:pyruvate dehydrogenase E1 component alpha subunit